MSGPDGTDPAADETRMQSDDTHVDSQAGQGRRAPRESVRALAHEGEVDLHFPALPDATQRTAASGNLAAMDKVVKGDGATLMFIVQGPQEGMTYKQAEEQVQKWLKHR